MNAPRDIKDRIAKRLLRHPRMVRDMLRFVPAEWLADVRLDSLRELPAEFISARGHRRVGDLLLLADRDDGRRLLLMVEHQSTPGRRMAARMTNQTECSKRAPHSRPGASLTLCAGVRLRPKATPTFHGTSATVAMVVR